MCTQMHSCVYGSSYDIKHELSCLRIRGGNYAHAISILYFKKKHVDTFPLGVSVTHTQHLFEELSILRNKISNL